MYSDSVIDVCEVSKCYQVFAKPSHRFYQSLFRHRKWYKEFWANRDVSFSVARGEAVAIIGKNGSGKSTLLQLICGTLQPSTGRIRVQGKIAALLELGAGFNPEYTGRENIYLSAAIYGLSQQETEARFANIVAFADIGDFIEQPVKTYSSGMFVRLAFSVIAHVDADVLVIDEALAVGDVFFTQKCMRFIRDFIKKGTLLFVSHDTNSVMSLCDKAVWLEGGRVRLYGSARQVCEHYQQALHQASHVQATSAPSVRSRVVVPEYFHDMRRDFMLHHPQRNELAFELFKPEAERFGTQGASIVDVHIESTDGRALSWIIGGEVARLVVQGTVQTDIARLIVGYVVKDKRGQNLFGENTVLFSQMGHIVSKSAGESFLAVFEFLMPVMPGGDYVISVAVADGTQEQHTVHCWINDALVFRSHSTCVSTGLLGVPHFKMIME